MLLNPVQAQQHEATLQEAQQQLQEQAAVAAASREAASCCQVEVELLQRKVDSLEAARLELLAQAEEDRAAAKEARQQVGPT